MNEITRSFSEHEQMPLRTYAEKAYLDYSMYVVLDRALPAYRRRSQTGAAAHHLCDERTGPERHLKTQEIRPHGR